MEITTENVQHVLAKLREEMPYKWKVQTAKHWGCECVAYVDARQVMDRLDEVVGPENWQDDYKEIGGNLHCLISILINGQWVTKQDRGTESTFEKIKGEASDSFKRAAVKWGIGRFLYEITTVRTKSLESGKDDRGNPKFVPCDEQGRRIYNVTGYVQNLQNRASKKLAPTKAEPAPEKFDDPLDPDSEPELIELAEDPVGASPVKEPARKPAQSTPPRQPNQVRASAPQPATQDQRDKIRLQCEALGKSGTEFSKYLQSKQISWKNLQLEQAKKLIDDLQSQIDQKSGKKTPEYEKCEAIAGSLAIIKKQGIGNYAEAQGILKNFLGHENMPTDPEICNSFQLRQLDAVIKALQKFIL